MTIQPDTFITFHCLFVALGFIYIFASTVDF